MINRSALLIRYKQPFVDWISGVDSALDSADFASHVLQGERTVYLVEVEDEEELGRWLERYHQDIFEQELFGWYTDPALWPRDRSLNTLNEWCSFELHTVVLDFGDSPLEDDDL